MISGRLVHLVETSGEEIIDRWLAQIRRDPNMPHTRSLMERELRDWPRDMLERLGYWLSGNNEKDLALRYERLGKLCVRDSLPLHETIRRMSMLREKILDFVQEHLTSNSSIQLFAEEELERRLGRFFDLLIEHVAIGYEDALRTAVPRAFAG
jgi:hypothetical protein